MRLPPPNATRLVLTWLALMAACHLISTPIANAQKEIPLPVAAAAEEVSDNTTADETADDEAKKETADEESTQKPNPKLSAEDQALQNAILDGRRIHREKIAPLQGQLQSSAISVQAELNAQRQLINLLKTSSIKSLPNLQRQLEQYSNQVEMYAKTIETVVDKDPEAKSKAIAAATAAIAKLELERRNSNQPYSQKLAEVYRRHAPDNQTFAKHFTRFFREQGTGDFDAYKRNQLTGNFGAAQVSVQYRDKGNIVTFSVNATKQSSTPNRNQKKLAGKYPILTQSDRNLTFYMESLLVSAYTSRTPLKTDEFQALIQNLVDLEALDAATRDLNEKTEDEVADNKTDSAEADSAKSVEAPADAHPADTNE